MNKPLPTDAINLERQPEPEADHIEGDDLAQIWWVLEFEEKTSLIST
jgi:integrase/recombinase XerD